jgi:oligopeptide transport system permease protein
VELRRFGVRVAWTVLSLVLFLSVLHAVFYALPGDPVRALFGLRSPGPELIAELRAAFGLDRPYPAQLWDYLTGLVTGDLGPVYRLSPNGLSPTGGSVGQLLGAAVPATGRLVGTAIVLQTVIGTALSVRMAGSTRRRHLGMTALVAALVAVPSFLLAALVEVAAPQVVRTAELLAGAACLAALPTGMVALVGEPLLRETRTAAYVRRATASGLPEGRVRWLHALRPSVGPLLAVGSSQTGNLLTAAILVEPILDRPGIGSVLVGAVNTRQGPTVLAVVGVGFALVAAANLLADLLATALDPRVDAL